METTFVVLFEKIIVYMPGKFWDGQNLAIFLAKIDSFEGFWHLTSKHRYESS